jgi:hypothetical protein
MPRKRASGKEAVMSLKGWMAAAVGSAALIGALGAASLAAWSGDQRLVLGEKVSAAFAAAPLAEVHRFEFYAPAGTVLTAKIQVREGNLQPEIDLLDTLEQEVDLGAAGSASGINRFTIVEAGWFTLRVRASSGIGRYLLITKGKFPKVVKATVDDDAFVFGAIRGSLLSASIKAAAGSAASPVFDRLDGPDGPVAITEGTKLSRVLLVADGEHELGWRDDGEGGEVSLALKVKAPKGRNTWFFDVVEDPHGIPQSIREAWLGSPHADRTAEAFVHWNVDGAVPTSCAKCHSSGGFQDFIGADGTAAGVVNNPAPLGTTVDCNACHNTTAIDLSSVTFPSGLMVDGLGAEARCMQCHQGRESSLDVDVDIAAAGVGDDETATSLRFLNIHYLSAAATLYGNRAQGAYQFAGKVYNNKVNHVPSHDSCTECHDPHTTTLKLDECATCHTGVSSYADLKNIRMERTNYDYDADGNTTEGVAGELEGMSNNLYAAIQQYALNALGKGILYDSHTYPYFFIDTDADGVSDPDEIKSSNGYKPWSPRLLRAAYNYQYSLKDPGAYAHNPRYMMQILYDAMEHLDAHEDVTVPNLAMMHRNEEDGHFDATADAYRHWDEDGEVAASCSRCHTPDGFSFFVKYGIDSTIPVPVSDGMTCGSCHVGDDFGTGSPALKYVDSVTFPSGVTVFNDSGNPDPSFVCMTCHQGRESAASVDAAIEAGTFSFKNIHYLAAGPTLFGAEAGVGYQYPGRSYEGKFRHFAEGPTNECTFCHGADHTFKPQLTELCMFCHDHPNGDIELARLNRETDYDGDGNNTEKLKDEVQSFGDRLYAAIRSYATTQRALNIAYDGHAYPYWFKDPNNNGVVDSTEGGNSNRYNKWDAALMKATFNFQMWQKEPGAWAHNTHYTLQLLYDSIQDLGGNTAGLTRPPGPAED